MNSSEVTTGRVYIDYDRVVQRVEGWLASKNPQIRYCEDDEVRARIVQRVVELSCDTFIKAVAESVIQANPALSIASPVINAAGLRICGASGALSISFKQWVRHIALFLGIWLRMLAVLFIAIFKRSPAKSVPVTILMEAGGGYEGGDEQFTKFCRKGPIGPLLSASRIVVRSQQAPVRETDPSFVYVAQPLIHLASVCLQGRHRVILLGKHLLAPMVLLRAVLKCPTSILVAQDIAYVPAVRWLDGKSLIEAIVITTSSFQSQPLWMKGLIGQRFKLNMIWYSQNFIPKVYVGELEESNLPSARHMRIDVHWVWTGGFRDYLQRIGQASEIRIVGPILWYLPEPMPSPKEELIRIAIFDITPLPDGIRPFGALKNYYSVSLMKQFILDIVDVSRDLELASGKKVSIQLKHKRKPKADFHDAQYLDFLQQVQALNSNFTLIDHQSNLFGLLELCDISISVPYTSTTYVASQLKKHAVYYDPFSELIPTYEQDNFIHFASGRSELRLSLLRYLGLAAA